MERLNIEYIEINKITPYQNNAKRHAEEDVAAIKASIEAFGMNDPIGVWGKNNLIIEGHGRMIALKELGYKEAPCIRLDRLTDEQRRGYALAHNKTAELSGWDFAKLEEELSGISEQFDMSAFGFELPDFDEGTESEQGDLTEKEKKTITCPNCGEIIEV